MKNAEVVEFGPPIRVIRWMRRPRSKNGFRIAAATVELDSSLRYQPTRRWITAADATGAEFEAFGNGANAPL